jgi:cell filamentation protein
MAKDPYVYPGTGVLRNNLEIRDLAELAVAEADIVRTALATLAEKPLHGSYDLAHWQAFHRRIFGGLYPWAGELRTVQIAKPNAFYARPEHIAGYAQGIFAELDEEHHLVGLDHKRSFDANVQSLNGKNKQLRELLEQIVDLP